TELEASGPMTDLHSGVYGGAAPNPFEALARIITKLKDESGKVLIPHFYDRVQKPTADELKAWDSLPLNEEHYRKTEVGSKVLTGEPGYSVLYRTWAPPTLKFACAWSPTSALTKSGSSTTSMSSPSCRKALMSRSSSGMLRTLLWS